MKSILFYSEQTLQHSTQLWLQLQIFYLYPAGELNSLNGQNKISELRALRYKQQASVLTNRESIWESAARPALFPLRLCAHSHLLRQQSNWSRSRRLLLHMTDCNDRAGNEFAQIIFIISGR